MDRAVARLSSKVWKKNTENIKLNKNSNKINQHIAPWLISHIKIRIFFILQRKILQHVLGTLMNASTQRSTGKTEHTWIVIKNRE